MSLTLNPQPVVDIAPIAYGLYLAISIALTIWVARTLATTGEIFLVRCFGQDLELAQSTNRLLVIGFYLVNLGFICFRLEFWEPQAARVIAEIGSRIGITLLALGLMHFFNMAMIARMGHTVGGWLAVQKMRQEPRPGAVPPPLPER
jgi:hypothetical protein